jgi:hypothetical protein
MNVNLAYATANVTKQDKHQKSWRESPATKIVRYLKISADAFVQAEPALEQNKMKNKIMFGIVMFFLVFSIAKSVENYPAVGNYTSFAIPDDWVPKRALTWYDLTWGSIITGEHGTSFMYGNNSLAVCPGTAVSSYSTGVLKTIKIWDSNLPIISNYLCIMIKLTTTKTGTIAGLGTTPNVTWVNVTAKPRITQYAQYETTPPCWPIYEVINCSVANAIGDCDVGVTSENDVMGNLNAPDYKEIIIDDNFNYTTSNKWCIKTQSITDMQYLGKICIKYTDCEPACCGRDKDNANTRKCCIMDSLETKYCGGGYTNYICGNKDGESCSRNNDCTNLCCTKDTPSKCCTIDETGKCKSPDDLKGKECMAI